LRASKFADIIQKTKRETQSLERVQSPVQILGYTDPLECVAAPVFGLCRS
jgi:hypothetical protein